MKTTKFFYHMNLHYSQTIGYRIGVGGIVFLPYEFTLLSNHPNAYTDRLKVFLPYEFTLLSNY